LWQEMALMFFDDWEQLSKPTIRPATPSDVQVIARIHVDGWRSTYQDVLSEKVLKGLKYADRERTWMRLIAGGDSGPYVLVADHPSDGIVGFVAAGPERSDNPAYAGEVYAIYVDKPHQRNGIGRSLIQYVAQIMSENAQQGLLLWTFSASPTNEFFTRLGAQEVVRRTRTFGEFPIEETAFGWPDLKRLLEEGYAAEDPRGAEPEEEHAASDEEQSTSN
jgi:GNAT superfamily N-acetyltransferase